MFGKLDALVSSGLLPFCSMKSAHPAQSEAPGTANLAESSATLHIKEPLATTSLRGQVMCIAQALAGTYRYRRRVVCGIQPIAGAVL